MSGISEEEQKQKHARIDAAIKASVRLSPDSAHKIALQTGEHVSLVSRRMEALGFCVSGGRWVKANNAK